MNEIKEKIDLRKVSGIQFAPETMDLNFGEMKEAEQSEKILWGIPQKPLVHGSPEIN